MSGVKHTPWKHAWESESSEWVVWGSVSAPDETGMTWQPAICTLSDSQGEDVARLIAAAPCMFEYILSSAQNGCATAQEIITRATGDRPEKGGAL